MLGIARTETCLASCMLLVVLINMLPPSCCLRILKTREDPPVEAQSSPPKVAGIFPGTSRQTAFHEFVAAEQLQINARILRGESSSIHLDQQKHQHHHHHRHKNHKSLVNANAAPPVDPPIHEVDAKGSTLSSEDHSRNDDDGDDDEDSEEMSFHADYAKVRTHPPHSH